MLGTLVQGLFLFAFYISPSQLGSVAFHLLLRLLARVSKLGQVTVELVRNTYLLYIVITRSMFGFFKYLRSVNPGLFRLAPVSFGVTTSFKSFKVRTVHCYFGKN